MHKYSCTIIAVFVLLLLTTNQIQAGVALPNSENLWESGQVYYCLEENISWNSGSTAGLDALNEAVDKWNQESEETGVTLIEIQCGQADIDRYVQVVAESDRYTTTHAYVKGDERGDDIVGHPKFTHIALTDQGDVGDVVRAFGRIIGLDYAQRISDIFYTQKYFDVIPKMTFEYFLGLLGSVDNVLLGPFDRHSVMQTPRHHFYYSPNDYDASVALFNESFPGHELTEWPNDLSTGDILSVEALYRALNTAPTAVDDHYWVEMDGQLVVTVGTWKDSVQEITYNDGDYDGDAFTINLDSDVSHGVLDFNEGEGSFIYTPNNDFSGTDSFTYSLNDGQDVSSSATVSIGVVEALSISTTSLSNGQIGVYYSETLEAVGGVAPYTWSLIDYSSLPAGITLNVNTGEIFGTPATEELSNFTVEVTDAVNVSAPQNLDISIDPSGPVLTQVTPNTGQRRTTSILTFTGDGFESGMSIDMGPNIRIKKVTFISSTELQVKVRIKRLAAYGYVDVTVTTPNGVSATLVNGFDVQP